MTVGELIDALSKYPRDTHVTINCDWEKDINKISYYPNLNSLDINLSYGY